MSGKKTTEAWDRTVKAADQLKPMAAQMRPLAKSTGEAARRQLFRTRAWAAPRVERTGKVIQESVAPKVSSMLSTAAERIDPVTKPRSGRWRLPVGIAAAAAAAASAAAAVFRSRGKADAAAASGDSESSDEAGESAANSDKAVSDSQVRAS